MTHDTFDTIQDKKVIKDFWNFYKKPNENSILTKKEELLVRLTASISGGCVP